MSPAPPHPGIGQATSSYSVKYRRMPDEDFDDYLIEQLENWCQTFKGHKDWDCLKGHDDNNRRVQRGFLHGMSRTWFAAWPRGTGPGCILEEPIEDDSEVEDRGVSKEWWDAMWAWISKYMFWCPPTRVLIECCLKALTYESQCPFYFFIPPAFRSRPTAFISHSWDLAAHCVFKCGADNDASSYWMDGFAVNQWNPMVEVMKIGQIVEDIGNTIVCIRGEGDPGENLRCMYRSWCVYEIVHTPDGCLRAHITAQNGNHRAYKMAIDSLNIKNAQSFKREDKETIDGLVLERYGTFEAATKVVQEEICKGYYRFFCTGAGFNGNQQKGEAFGAANYGRW